MVDSLYSVGGVVVGGVCVWVCDDVVCCIPVQALDQCALVDVYNPTC